jgi:hypothetical protein
MQRACAYLLMQKVPTHYSFFFAAAFVFMLEARVSHARSCYDGGGGSARVSVER